LVGTDLSESDSAEIGSISALTPGDFKTTYQKHAFFEKSEISHRRLIHSLRQEVLVKNEKSFRKMGF
jgi:hypothetical protein